MSQVDDEFNELEEEMFEEQNDVQGTDEGPSSHDLEPQAVASPSGQRTDQENDAAADIKLPPDDQQCHASGDVTVGGDQPVKASTEGKPEADVATAGPVKSAAVEAEEPPQAKERKLKPTFKKATKKATQKEETVAGKPVEAQPATADSGETTETSPIKNGKDSNNSKSAAPTGDATTDKRQDKPKETKPKLQVKKAAIESTTGNSNDARQESKSTLPVKKTATKAKPASGPPDPCSFNCAGKSTNSKKKAGKNPSDGPERDNKMKTAESGKKPPQNRRPQAKSAYMFFCSEQRDVIKDENLSFADVGRRLGEIWRGMDEDDKKPYQEQAEKDKARVAALPDVSPPVAKKARKAPVTKAKKEEAVKDASEKPCPQDADKEQSPPKKATGRRGGSRVSKRKANQALAADDAEDDDQYDSEYDWEADHEDVDWSNHPAECIIAVTMKGKYVVKRKGLPLHEYGVEHFTCRLVDSQAAKRHCSGQAGASSSICHVTKEMINDFESSKKGFEKDTVDHMSSRELDLDDLEHVTRLEACAFLGDMRREGLLDKKGCKVWSFPDERMSVPIMGTSYLVQRLLECERNSRQELVDENQEMKALLAEHGINWPRNKSANREAMEE